MPASAAAVAWGALRVLERWTGDAWFSSPTANTIARGLAFLALQPLVSAPFVDLLTEKVKAPKTGRLPPSAGFWGGLGQTLAQFDIILMSYSLSGVPDERLAPFLKRLFDHLTPRGQILFATYQDGCPWDRYAGQVYEALGVARSGGVKRHLEKIRGAGFDAQHLVSLDTFIWAHDPAPLFEALEFFFLGNTEQYHASRPAFEGALLALAEPLPGGRTGIGVVESLFRITP
jgi:hypothetical protein